LIQVSFNLSSNKFFERANQGIPLAIHACKLSIYAFVNLEISKFAQIHSTDQSAIQIAVNLISSFIVFICSALTHFKVESFLFNFSL
jgi:hypothetical protein